MQLFFATTLLLSATLLFVVEPMFAKKVLPLLGGSPSVWNTCLVFYQGALLAGYVYAHLSLKWLGTRRQAMLHVGLLCLPWLVMALPASVPPLGVPLDWTPPRDQNPVPWLWLLLTVRLGLPFLIVSATAPMLQAWFADTGHRAAKDPYFLYAASNLGSMIGLAAYPLVIEPRLTLSEQSWWWAGGYGVLMALVTGCAMVLWMSRRPAVAASGTAPELIKPHFEDDGTAGKLETCPTARDVGQVSNLPSETPPTLLRRLRWLALALVPSSLLLGVTTHISTDIASVPLLWAIPLALYLLSFVLVFAQWSWWIAGAEAVLPVLTRLTRTRAVLAAIFGGGMAGIQAVLLALTGGVFFLSGIWSSDITESAMLHLAAFFATAMVCHGALAADRPSSRYLTEFYLWMSLGGVVGGLFNALVAPVLFNSVLEYPLMLVAACLLRPRPNDRYGCLSPKLGLALAAFGAVVLYRAGESVNRGPMGTNWDACWSMAKGAGLSKALNAWDAFDRGYKVGLLALAVIGAAILWAMVMALTTWLKARRKAERLRYEGDANRLEDRQSAERQVGNLRHAVDALRDAFCARFASLLPPSWRPKGQDAGNAGSGWSGVVLMALVAAVYVSTVSAKSTGNSAASSLRHELVGLGMFAALGFARRPLWFAVALAVLLDVSWMCAGEKKPLYAARSFFGVLRVEREELSDADGKYHQHKLMHGSTLHGTQRDPADALDEKLTAEDKQDVAADVADPWTYYHRTGPVGKIVEELEKRSSFLKQGHIGVVGLGTGSVAAYGKPGQHLTYFEIDPAVKEIAEAPDYFTYLSNCKAEKEVVLGDARLRLADRQDGEFDLLFVDAFSSDAIPIHLLTREAMSLYAQKLASRGLLAVHISNRHLDLEPVVLNLAADLGLVAGICGDDDEGFRGKCSSHWVVLTRRFQDLGDLKGFEVLQLHALSPDVPSTCVLTRQGIQPCLKKVADEGVLLVRVSGHYEDVKPLLLDLAGTPDIVIGVADPTEDRYGDNDRPVFVTIGRSATDFTRLKSMFKIAGPKDAADSSGTVSTPSRAEPFWHLTLKQNQRPWRDDFSNIISVIHDDLVPGHKTWALLKSWWRKPQD